MKPGRTLEALDLIKNLFQCNFNTNISKELLQAFLPKEGNTDPFFFPSQNFRLWNVCSTILPYSVACLFPKVMEKTCEQFPIRLIKTTRLRVKKLKYLLDESHLNLKVIVLVRDPRGMLKSRSTMEWCNTLNKCTDIKSICDNLLDDFLNAKAYASMYPKRILLVRYEDLSLEPYNTLDKIMDFLELPSAPEFLDSFLASHTGRFR